MVKNTLRIRANLGADPNYAIMAGRLGTLMVQEGERLVDGGPEKFYWQIAHFTPPVLGNKWKQRPDHYSYE